MSDVAFSNQRNLETARRQEGPANFHVPQKSENHAKEGDKQAHKERLNASRRISGANPKNAVKAVKDIASAASLWKYVNPITDMPIAVAFCGALLKDLLDMVTFETVILPMILGALCTILILMMLFLAGAGGKRKGANKIILRILLIIGGGVVDAVPGIDFLPVETATVATVYYTMLVERRDAAQAGE